jgi:PIN domain nuclease of toxin-antitoxin system
MKLLLDTHTTIWWLDAPQKLGKAGFRMIADPENEVLISAIVP